MQDRIELYRNLVAGLDRAVVLFALQDVGVFKTLLGGALTTEEIARKTATNTSVLVAFLDLVVALGVLNRADECYSLIPGDEPIFEEGTDVLNILKSPPSSAWLPRWKQFAMALRHGSLLAKTEDVQLSEAQKALFMRDLDSYSRAVAAEIGDLLSDLRPRYFADLGCGLGTYAFALLGRCPEARAVLVDQPQAERAILERAHQLAVETRVSFQGADILRDEIGKDLFDVVILSNVLHDYDAARAQQVLHNAARRVQPGGWLAIKDIDIDHDRRGPLSALDFRASIAVFTGGDLWSEETVRVWLRDAGLVWRRTHSLRQERGAYLILAQASDILPA